MSYQAKRNSLPTTRHILHGVSNGSPINAFTDRTVSAIMGTHILIVDDESRVTSALRRVLAYEGYTVSTAADGENALAIARTRPPDLVILDIMLPRINGLEVCRRLRIAGDDVDVLMLTARDTVADRVTA